MSSPARLQLVPDAPDSVDAGPQNWLGDVASSLAAARDLWSARVLHDPRRRFFERLVATENYDAWLVGWSPGQAIAAHDHGQSAGALVVTQGSIVETHWDDDVPTARTIIAGDVPLVFGPDHVHGVANLCSGPATSIHVYSPALRTMGWFAGEDGTTAPRRRREERVLRESSHPQSIDALLGDARTRLQRLLPEQARLAAADGALLVDIRPEVNRRLEGSLPGAIVVDRNVLEWRLDPASPDRLPQVSDHDVRIVLVCNEGYASSLAAGVLHDLGLSGATDLDGGFRAWKRAGLPTLAVESR
jgi:rhodanese-related sulfurtransferase/predicted metal-dependent enzyme (double-stranded beta helix superfamily)